MGFEGYGNNGARWRDNAKSGGSSNEASSWQRAVSAFRDLFRAEAAAIVVHYFEHDRGRVTHAVGIEAAYTAAYENRYSHRNVWFQEKDLFRFPGTVNIGSQLIADNQLRETDFYKDWLKPQNLRHHLFGVVERQGDTVVCLVLSRSDRNVPFVEDDAARLSAMLHAISCAWRLERVARARTADAGAAWKVLNRLALGIVLLDDQAKVAALNLKALEILKRGDSLTLRNGQLTCRIAQENQQLKSNVMELIEATPTKPTELTKAMALSRPDGKTPLHLIFSRVSNGTAAGGRRRHMIAVFLSDPEQVATPREEWLQDLYGLTRVESRLAVLMCQGLTPDDIAKTLRISVHTVRAYLKDVFFKMGVNRQATMVQRLVDGPGQLRIGSEADLSLGMGMSDAGKPKPTQLTSVS
jgi:DNA-binding CsgD family transcriptional regulator